MIVLSLGMLADVCLMCLSHRVVVKGAPEVIEGLLGVVPAHYRATYRRLSFAGGRVLALAHNELSSETSIDDVKRWSRDQVERNLHFAGFFVRHFF